MKIERQKQFTESISTLNIKQLKTLETWLRNKASEESREDKLRLIRIAIEGKEKHERLINGDQRG